MNPFQIHFNDCGQNCGAGPGPDRGLGPDPCPGPGLGPGPIPGLGPGPAPSPGPGPRLGARVSRRGRARKKQETKNKEGPTK